MASADGFKAFYLEWQRARTERAKWNKASAHAARMYTRKAHFVWVDFWMENRRHRHLSNFSLRNIRRNRCNRAFGIWCAAHRSSNPTMLAHPVRVYRRNGCMAEKGSHFCELTRGCVLSGLMRGSWRSRIARLFAMPISTALT